MSCAGFPVREILSMKSGDTSGVGILLMMILVNGFKRNIEKAGISEVIY